MLLILLRKKYLHNPYLLVIISGMLSGYTVSHAIFMLAAFCFIPFFIALHQKTTKEAVKLGLVFGLSFSLVAYFWMIPAAAQFTGGNITYGVVASLISIIVFSFFWTVLSTLFVFITNANRFSVVVSGLVAASYWVVIEFLWQKSVATMPWFYYQSGHAMLSNLYAIQPASLFGVHVISFVVIFLNYLFASYLVQANWKKLFIPVIIFGAYLIWGGILLHNFENKAEPVGNEVKIAILAGNISSEMKWDDKTGNQLVKNMLALNKQAVDLKPQIVLWSESAIPWTFKADDDLILEVLRTTSKAQITHVLGMNTQGESNKIYNSAYCILPDGSVVSRYDKQSLLSLIEKPYLGLLLPFYACSDCTYGQSIYSQPLSTPYGNAGIMICNETVLAENAAKMVNGGAEFFLNMGNDAWFSETYIPELHFCQTRLRAVESRKDIVINSNLGVSGFVKASGRIEMKRKSKEAFVKMFSVKPNSYRSLSVINPIFFVYISAIFLLGSIVVSRRNNKL